MAALALFIFVALPHFNAANFEPFMPNGFPRSGPSGSEVGVMAAAAIIFFAFYGFDAIATDLGVSKSWASRLHAQAMAALAEVLRPTVEPGP